MHFRALLLAVSGLLYGELAYAAHPFAFDPHRSQSERIAAVALVDHGDGTYHYELLDPALVPSGEVRTGAITWRYDGQATFSHVPERSVSTWVRETGQVLPLVDRLVSTARTDRYGRRWVAVDVDLDEARLLLDLERERAGEPGSMGIDPTEEPPYSDPSAVTEGLWIPQRWHAQECDPASGTTINRWNDDDRWFVRGALTERQKTVALLLNNGIAECSATFVDSRWLLTAAHCVTNNAGVALDPLTIDICTRANMYADSECQAGVDTIVVAPGWNGSRTSDDYAVVRSRLPFQHDNGFMYISDASDGFIQDLPMHNLAFPAWGPGCSRTHWAASDPGFDAIGLYKHRAEIVNLTGARIKTRHDGVGGHSGSPMYYCPEGDARTCSAGEAGYITGVWSGYYDGLTDGHRGPKGSAIQGWVVLNTP